MTAPTSDIAVSHAQDRDRVLRLGLPAALLLVAAVGWWWSVRMQDDMTGSSSDGMGMGMAMDEAMSFGSFGLAWVAMMAAMMLPAVLPVVQLYALAAARGRAAPLPFFVAGYLLVWSLMAVPGYLAWRELEMPIADGEAWAARLAGGVLIAAAVWQVTPLKSACLRHCRSPLGFFMRHGKRLAHPLDATRMGALHGLFCLGCCWALFAVLVAVGTMNVLWMIGLAALIVVEKTTAHGERLALVGALVLAVLGGVLLADPSQFTNLT